MKREFLMALTVLSLAGCAATQTSETRMNSVGHQTDPHCCGQILATM